MAKGDHGGGLKTSACEMTKGKEYEDFMKFIEKPDEENRRDMLELKRMDARRTNDRKSQRQILERHSF